MLDSKLRQKLVKRCTDPIEAFAGLGQTTQTKDGPMTFIDNGGCVLGVAHLDWVMSSKPRWDRAGTEIRCPQLDDRLGVWVLLDLLPSMGLNFDVLLTDSEECGRSTAAYFQPETDYNWMFQFDRAGTDVVLYDYENDDNVARLEEAGFQVGYGSYSDICRLDHLGIEGINFGVGYHRQHTKGCYGLLAETLHMASLFADYFAKYRRAPFAYEPRPQRVSLWDRCEAEYRDKYGFREDIIDVESWPANDPRWDILDEDMARMDEYDEELRLKEEEAEWQAYWAKEYGVDSFPKF